LEATDIPIPLDFQIDIKENNLLILPREEHTN